MRQDKAEPSVDLPRLEREIGDHTYRCQRLLLGDWIELEALIVKVLGMQILDLDEKNLASYAPLAIKGSSRADHEMVFELLGKCLMVKNDRGTWSSLTRREQNRWWPTYMREMPATIALFFEVQFGDFFKGLDLLLPAKSKAEESQDGQESPDLDESLGV